MPGAIGPPTPLSRTSTATWPATVVATWTATWLARPWRMLRRARLQHHPARDHARPSRRTHRGQHVGTHPLRIPMAPGGDRCRGQCARRDHLTVRNGARQIGRPTRNPRMHVHAVRPPRLPGRRTGDHPAFRDGLGPQASVTHRAGMTRRPLARHRHSGRRTLNAESEPLARRTADQEFDLPVSDGVTGTVP